MGSDLSIEQLQESTQLRDWCYEAVNTLMDLDKKYAESVEEVAKKAEPTTRNMGSNVNNSMIVASTSKVNITQKTKLETVVKTSFYTTSLNALKMTPEAKLIMCDIIGLTKANADESVMPAYGDPKYLLRILGIENVKTASIENDTITYTDDADQTHTEPVQKIREFIHAYYAATLKEKIETSAPAIENISSNMQVSAQNVASNSIKIKLRRNQDGVFNFNQSNESVIKITAEFKELGQKLSELRNRPPPTQLPNNGAGDPATGVPPSGVQMNVQETRNQSESVKDSDSKTESKTDNTTINGVPQNPPASTGDSQQSTSSEQQTLVIVVGICM